MSKKTKAQRKAARSSIRKVMESNDKEVRSGWKSPPLWVVIVDLFKPGRVSAWQKKRALEHENRQRYAFRKTAKMLKQGERA